MSNTDPTTLVIALWGAATGTVAVAIQVIQQLADRARLSVKASMSHTIDRERPIARLCVEVEIANHGRRPLAIEHIGIVMPNKKKPDPNVRNMRTYATLFDARSSRQFIRLAEGDKHTIRQDFFPQEWGRSMWKKGKTAKAFARLTSGKEHFAKFYLIDPRNFPPDAPQSAPTTAA